MKITVITHPHVPDRVVALSLLAFTFEEERILTALLDAIKSGNAELTYPCSHDDERVMNFRFESLIETCDG